MTVYATEPTIPQAVLDAALVLHQGKCKDLTFGPFGNADEEPAESNPLWRCVDGQIEFANLEARNRCAALATFQQLMPLSREDALFEAAYELWRHEIGYPDLASGRLLGLASQNVNVLSDAARAIKAQEHQKLDVFDYLHLVEAGLSAPQKLNRQKSLAANKIAACPANPVPLSCPKPIACNWPMPPNGTTTGGPASVVAPC